MNDTFDSLPPNGTKTNETDSLAADCLTNECLFWQDVIGFPLVSITATFGLALNGFIVWVLRHSPAKTPFDVIQMNVAICYIVDTASSAITITMARVIMSFGKEVKLGLWIYFVDNMLMVISINIDNMATILMSLLRTAQV